MLREMLVRIISHHSSQEQMNLSLGPGTILRPLKEHPIKIMDRLQVVDKRGGTRINLSINLDPLKGKHSHLKIKPIREVNFR